jgi:phosphatidylinositol-3-phosphatase
MHDGSVAQADSWLSTNLSSYANWAKANDSLLIVTWDEDDNSQNNQIPTILFGANARPGTYGQVISHYNVLSTVQQIYGLTKTGYAAMAPPISEPWG